MTASIDINNPEHPKRVLMVAANPSTSTQTGWPVGFWWAELTHPYWEFTEHGYQVDIASPDGGTLIADGFSDPEDESGYSAHDLISLGFKHSPQHAALLDDTPKLADLELGGYDALFLVGGQSPMYTFRNNPDVETAVRRFFEAGKPTAIVCHATSLLLDATTSAGERIVTGKTWTGFADAEEAFADNFVGQKIQPYWIEDEAKKLPDTNFVVNTMFKPFAVRDGNLITGQQQYSGAAAARLVIETLGV
ncbi:MAG: type 1 glutamine amidotransferase domain-containing protein [Acidimicrobiales bacterium]|nr:type 1 glutamine amidotransferase domain-containing protein [Acidimicrobiales bacterium]